MLVLTRKPNQQLKIGSDIVITVVKIRGNTIRLGIEAPRDVRVVRSELDAKPQESPSEGTAPREASIEAAAPSSGSEAGEQTAPAAASTVPLPKNVLRAPKRSALKPFISGKQSPVRHAGRNLEDSPLCHAGQSAQRAVPSLIAAQC